MGFCFVSEILQITYNAKHFPQLYWSALPSFNPSQKNSVKCTLQQQRTKPHITPWRRDLYETVGPAKTK